MILDNPSNIAFLDRFAALGDNEGGIAIIDLREKQENSTIANPKAYDNHVAVTLLSSVKLGK